jgi:O-antigen/teichoic acid export membrane protein
MAKKSIAKNYIYNMVYQVLILILPLITTPYLSRVLGAEGIGIYSYTYAIVTYFILFGSLGVALYGQREIAYAQENAEARKKVFIEVIIFRFITIAIATVFYYILFVNGKEYQVYYRILLLELIAAAFDISWFFQGMEEFKRTVTRNVLVRICSVTLVFILVKTKEDLAKFTLIYSLADLIGNLSLWLYLPKYLKGIKVKNINVLQHLPQIILLFIPQIANQIYKILDTTMIGKLVTDKAETGYYEQGQKVIRLLLTIVTSLGVVMIPRMASTFASGDKKKINEYMKMSFQFVFFLAFPIMFGIISISKEFVPVFFGSGYEKVAILINIISPILILMGVANVVGTQYLLPTKRQKEYTISITIGVVVNFFLNYVLIKKFASIGASIATVLSQLVVDIVQFIYIKDEIKVMELLKLGWKYLVSSIVMFVFCFVVRIILNTNNVSELVYLLANNLQLNRDYFFNCTSIVLQVIIGAITYIVMLIILKDDYIYKFIDRVKERFSKKKVA